MILVELGTQDKSFKRLLDMVEKEIENKTIKEEVIVQAGYTEYSSKNMKVFDYLPKDELEKLIDKASFLIVHGGVGSIFDGLKKDKKIIAVPRLSKYKEHNNDHQLQITTEFNKDGFILTALDNKEFHECLKKINKFKPKKYQSNTNNMIKLIEDYIDKGVKPC